MTFKLSNHAKEEMAKRLIPLAALEQVLNNPQQIVVERGNLKAYQSVISFEDGRNFLLRVVVDDTIDPVVVVTAYRTSKVGKYWRIS